MLIANIAASGLDAKTKRARRPLMAQPSPGVGRVTIQNESTGALTDPSLGKGIFRHQITLDNGVELQVDATRKLSDQDQSDYVASYVKTPEYAAQLAKIESEKKRVASIPATERGPYDSRRARRDSNVISLDELRQTARATQSGTSPGQNYQDAEANAKRPRKQRSVSGFEGASGTTPGDLAGFLRDTGNQMLNTIPDAVKSGMLAGQAYSQGQNLDDLARMGTPTEKGRSQLEKVPATRVASRVVEFGQYLIPGVGQALGIVQSAQIGDSIFTKGLGPAMNEVLKSVNPAEPGIYPEDRILRSAGLLLGAWHLKGRTVTAVEASTLARKLRIKPMDAMRLVDSIKSADRSQQAVANAYLKWAQETGYDRGVREGMTQQAGASAPVASAPVPAPAPTMVRQPGASSGLLGRRPTPPSLEQLAAERNTARETQQQAGVDAAYQNVVKPSNFQSRDEFIADRWRRSIEADIAAAQAAIQSPEQTFPGMGERARRREVARLRTAIRAARADIASGKVDPKSKVEFGREWDQTNKPPLTRDAGAEPAPLPQGVVKVEPKNGSSLDGLFAGDAGVVSAAEPAGQLRGQAETGPKTASAPEAKPGPLPKGVTDTRGVEKLPSGVTRLVLEGQTAPEAISGPKEVADVKSQGAASKTSAGGQGAVKNSPDSGIMETRASWHPEAIRISPEPGGDFQTVGSPISAVEDLLKKKLLQGKQARNIPGAVGYYDPGTGATTTKNFNSLEAGMHEVAHALDHRYGITKAVIDDAQSASPTPELLKELDWFDKRGGSGQYVGNPSSVVEAFAEWTRSYLSDPASTEKQSPAFTEYMRRTLPADVWQSMSDTSQKVRQWAGLTSEEKHQIHIQSEKVQPSKRKRLSEFNSTGNGIDYRTPKASRLKAAFTSGLDPVKRALEEAYQRGAPKPNRPSEDPYQLARDHAYIAIRVDEMITSGLTEAHSPNVIPAFRGKDGFASIYGALDNSSPKALRADLRRAEAYIVAQATVERHATLRKKLMDEALSAKESAMGFRSDKAFQAWLRTEEGAKWWKAIDRRTRWEAYQEMKDSTGVTKMTGNDVKEAQNLIRQMENDPTAKSRYDEYAKLYRSWAEGLINYARDKGRLSPEDASRILATKDYAAMNRAMESEGLSGGPSRGLLKGRAVAHKRTGSTREILSPTMNLIEQTARIIGEADRNEVLAKFVDTFDRSGQDVSAIAVRAEPGAKGGVTIYRNGEKQTWVFEEGIQKALESMGKRGSDSEVVRAAKAPARWLRNGVTMVPAFQIRNKARDIQAASLLSRHGLSVGDILKEGPTAQRAVGMVTGKGSLKERNAYVTKNIEADRRLYRLYGAGIANERYIERAGDYYKTQHRLMASSTDPNAHYLDISKQGRGLQNWYLKLMEGVESSTRIAEMKKAIETVDKMLDTTGWSEHDYALYGARSSRNLIDFADGGELVKAINEFIPFTNANVQGLRATYQAARANPKRFAAAVVARSVLGAAAVYAWNKAQGQDGLDDYNDLPDYKKDNFMSFRIGPGKFLHIPKPYDLGVPQSVLTRAFMAIDKGEQPDWDAIKGTTVNSLSPLKVDDVLGGPYSGVMEARTNYDTFRNQNVVPPYEVNKYRSQRDMSKASRIGKGISEALFQGANLDADARTVDQLIRNLFGNAGTLALDVSDVAREDKGLSAFQWAGNLAGVAGQSNPMSSKDVQRVMDMAMKAGSTGNPFGGAYDLWKKAKTEAEKRRASMIIRKAARQFKKVLGPLFSKSDREMTENDIEKIKAILNGSPYKRPRRTPQDK